MHIPWRIYCNNADGPSDGRTPFSSSSKRPLALLLHYPLTHLDGIGRDEMLLRDEVKQTFFSSGKNYSSYSALFHLLYIEEAMYSINPSEYRNVPPHSANNGGQSLPLSPSFPTLYSSSVGPLHSNG